MRLPCGSWPSPIPAELLVTGATDPTAVHVEDGTVWWSRSRPDQGGRQQVVRLDRDGVLRDALPGGFNARTRVHEYGGGAWWVHAGAVFACSWVDQRLYRVAADGDAVALTPEPARPHDLRYADGVLTPDGGTVICVRESHREGEVRNEIVALDAFPDPSSSPRPGPADPAVLDGGHDFVAAPRVSPDGRRLAWLAWDHPNMPWDSTQLWVAELYGTGSATRIERAHRVAGQPGESLVQPQWAPDGTLHVVSDRTDWWNVYRVDGPDQLTAVHLIEAEIARPAWVFGQSQYTFTSDGTCWMTFSAADGAHLLRVDPGGVGPGGEVRDLVLPASGLAQLRADGDRLVAILTDSYREPYVAALQLATSSTADDTPTAEQRAEPRIIVLAEPRELGLDPRGLSAPEAVSFPSAEGRTAHAWFYPPAGVRDGEQLAGAEGELPPLITMIHGGPTAAADPSFDLEIQFWTSRGFAVVNVDYGGSTGYGRAYRRLLDGAWGVVDVQDACAAATWLAKSGRVDGARLAITGGSAGGFTVLAALATQDVFAAGASYYGVADLSALAQETHKFESRYLDRLIGPWPQSEPVYTARSPLSHIDGFDRPLLVLQGLEDEVVPPAQSEMIVDALRRKKIPHAYLPFEGEQHGFRIDANIVRALNAELSFYAQVFGFEPADPVEPLAIEFADQLGRRV